MINKDQNDAYGKAICDYQQGLEAFEIVERDDGYFSTSDGPEEYFAPFRKWPRHQKKAIKLAKRKVLDIGTGAGKAALHLQKKGLEVLAVDNSPLAIKTAKNRGVKLTKLLSIEEISKLEPQKFDTILMLGNNLGLLQNQKKATEILKKLEKLTNQNSIIIAESQDPKHFTDEVHQKYHQKNKNDKKLPGRYKIKVHYKEYCTQWFEYLYIAPKDLENIIQKTSWRVDRLIQGKNASYIAILTKTKK